MPELGRSGVHIISLLIDPSFGDAENIEFRWNLFPAYYICWHDLLPELDYVDYQMENHTDILDDSWIEASSLASTRKTRTINVETTSFEIFLTYVHQTRLPPLIRMSHAGEDGTSYKLTIGNSPSQVTYTWWVEPPSEWLRLGEISNMMIDIVRRSKKRFA